MADEFDMSNVPQLSLTPDLSEGVASPAAAAVAAAEAPAPTLEENTAKVKDAIQEELSRLSPAERKAVEDFAQKIDIADTGVVLQYGAAAQKKVADFSDAALANVRTKDLGEVGDKLSNLVVELKGMNFTEEEKKGLFGGGKKAAKNQEADLDIAIPGLTPEPDREPAGDAPEIYMNVDFDTGRLEAPEKKKGFWARMKAKAAGLTGGAKTDGAQTAAAGKKGNRTSAAQASPSQGSKKRK